MAARSIASLTLSFGLVSIPVRLFAATESAAAVRFNLLAPDGARLKQQYVSERDGKVVPRAEMVKGYEFEKDRFVLFSPEELKALEESPDPTVSIHAFVPEASIDPLYHDKAYLLAPDKRGGKPYALLAKAMRESGRSALAKWRWKGREHIVQVRAHEDGLVLQQLLQAEEVRSLRSLEIEKVDVSPVELQLALQLIDQITQERFEPTAYVDEERKRVLSLIDAKIAGQEVVTSAAADEAQPASAQVIDLMAALQASLGQGGGKRGAAAGKTAAAAGAEADKATAPARKGARRAAASQAPGEQAPQAAADVEQAAPAPRRRSAAR